MEDFYCEICNAPMELIKKVDAKDRLKQSSRGRAQCRIRRFECSVCDYTNTVYADGKRDLNNYTDK